ncbi:MAG: hypothetical protein ACXAC7_01650 [Candidatus Hodarchaeales archaeon]|jgi:hypothetical protein
MSKSHEISQDLLSRLENLFKQKLLSENTFYRQQAEISQTFNKSKKGKSDQQILFNSTAILYYYQLLLFKQKLENKISSTEKKIQLTAKEYNSKQLSEADSISSFEELVRNQNSLKKINKIIQDQLPNLPYSPRRSSEDIDLILRIVEPLTSHLSLDQLKKLFMNNFLHNERNSAKLNKMLNLKIKDTMLDSEEYQLFSSNFLNELSNLVDTAISPELININFENKIIPKFEKYFKQFKSVQLSPKHSIPWPETLTDKNRQNYLFNKKDKELSQVTIPIKTPEIPTDRDSESTITIEPPQKTEIERNLWDMIGSIFIDPVNKGLGYAGIPVTWKDGHIYQACHVEKELESDYTDALFRESQSLRILGISDSTESRRERLREEIANTLDIPLEVALFPTIVREYLGRRNIEVNMAFKDQLLRKEYYLIDKLNLDPQNRQIMVMDELEPAYELTGSVQFSSPPSGLKDFKSQQYKLNLWDATTIGQILTEVRLFSLGYHLIIELDFPSEAFLSSFLPKIRSFQTTPGQPSLWELRFQISKKIDVFEGEALLPHNLWSFINSEKVPILPFDVYLAYIAIIPSGGIETRSTTNELMVKRGITPQLFSEYLLKDLYYTVKDNQIQKGLTIGITLNEEHFPEIIYCSLSSVEILKRMNRDSSIQAQKRLKKRIKKALGVEESKAFHPRNLIVYLLFYSAQFSVLIDFGQYRAVVDWLSSTFDFHYLSLELIKEINHESREILINA